MSPRAIIAPSILASDFGNLTHECTRILSSGADWLHIDIMDGHFVPNITIGAPVVTCIRSSITRAEDWSKGVFDCHMMVANPQRWIADFKKAGCDLYCFHYEAAEAAEGLGEGKTAPGERTRECVRLIKEAGLKAGVAIKPDTPAEVLFPVMEGGGDTPDMLLVMSVEPGFGGQKFMERCMPKVTTLRERYPEMDIEVDGGVSPGPTIESAAKAGANVIVSGTGVFAAKDPKEAIAALRDAVKKRRK